MTNGDPSPDDAHVADIKFEDVFITSGDNGRLFANYVSPKLAARVSRQECAGIEAAFHDTTLLLMSVEYLVRRPLS